MEIAHSEPETTAEIIRMKSGNADRMTGDWRMVTGEKPATSASLHASGNRPLIVGIEKYGWKSDETILLGFHT
jgi:hypothetical protein